MSNELRQQIQEGDKERKKYLRMIRIGEMLMNFGRRWLARQDEEFRGSSLLLRIIIVVTLFVIGLPFVAVLVIYIVLHVGSYFTGKVVSNKFTRKLQIFENIWMEKYHRYFETQSVERNIVFDEDVNYVVYEHEGITVDARGMVHAQLREPTANLYLYILKDNGDFRAFEDLKLRANDDTVILNKNIASIDFNKKFGAVADKADEIESIKYLSPTRQVKMIKTPELENFFDIHMRKLTFRARTNNRIDMPAGINVYEKKHLMKYFEEAEKYCINLKTMADTVKKDYLKIAFLLER